MTSINSSTSIQSSVLTSFGSQAEMAAELGGDVNAQMAAMVLKHSQESREDLETVRDLEEANITKLEREQVESMMDQADAVRTAGLISGGTQMASAAFGALGSITAAKGQDEVAQVFNVIAQGAGGVGELAASGSHHDAAVAQANATQQGNAAEAAKRRFDEVNSELDEVRAFAREGMDFLKEIRRTEAATNSAALFLKV